MTIGPFWTGDSPAAPIELDLYSEDDLSVYTSATITLHAPDWAAVGSPIVVPFEGEPAIAFTLPAASLGQPGIHTLVPRLTSPTGSVTLPASEFVVQEDTGWHTLDSARQAWSSAPDDDPQLYRLLETARVQCAAYAPKLTGQVSTSTAMTVAPDPENAGYYVLVEPGSTSTAPRPPVNYKQAQLLQARGIWQSTMANVRDQSGPDQFPVTVFPMDWTVKALLRPKRGLGGVA